MSTRPILTYFYTTINIDDDTWGKLKYLDLCNRTESWEQQKVNQASLVNHLVLFYVCEDEKSRLIESSL